VQNESNWHKAYERLCKAITGDIDDTIDYIIQSRGKGEIPSTDKVLISLFSARDTIIRHYTQALTDKSSTSHIALVRENAQDREQEETGDQIEGQTAKATNQDEPETTNNEEAPMQQPTCRADFLFLAPPLNEAQLKVLNDRHKQKSGDALPDALMHAVVVAQTKSVKLPVFPQGNIHGALHYRATLPSNTFPPNIEITEAMLIIGWTRKALWHMQKIPGNLNMLMEWNIGSDGIIRE
jgi:hypothetical protein